MPTESICRRSWGSFTGGLYHSGRDTIIIPRLPLNGIRRSHMTRFSMLEQNGKGGGAYGYGRFEMLLS